MIQKAAPIIVALLFAAPCLAQVHVDYDRSADFSKYATFSWSASEETSVKDTDPLMHDRIVKAIQDEVVSSGLKSVDSSPDLYVTYHTDEKQEMSLNTTSFGYGYSGSWGWDPYYDFPAPTMGSSHTTSYTYVRGTLIVDIWDAGTKELIFRGSATAVVAENPKRAERQINKAIGKIAKKFGRMHKSGR